MSSRRARIKAVASLPARRKGPTKEPDSSPLQTPNPVREAIEEQVSSNEKASPLVTGATKSIVEPAHRRRAVRPAVCIPARGGGGRPPPLQPCCPSSPARSPAKPPSSPCKPPSSPCKPSSSPCRTSSSLCRISPIPCKPPPSPCKPPPSPCKSCSSVVSPHSPNQASATCAPLAEPSDSMEECLFDPIIPLPNNNKNRLKLRPTPKLALRRNSFQGGGGGCGGGGALEAEEHTSVRAARPAPAAPTRHNALTMYDLIFYNPPNNAIKHEAPPPMAAPLERPPSPELPPPTEPEVAPVPQVKLGPNGEIVIDEQSLVMETSEALRSRQRLAQLAVVWEGAGAGTGGAGLYGRGRRCRDWGRAETLRFYRALHTLGTDFSLMLSLFPGRTRRDLKVKFKKEERQNGALVDRALMNPLQFDIGHLEEEAALLREEEEEKALQDVKPPKADAPAPKPRKRKLKTSAALDSIQEGEGREAPSGEAEGEAEGPVLSFGGKRYKQRGALASDGLARQAEALLAGEAGGGGQAVQVPPGVEAGSLVILQGAPPARELRAFLVQLHAGQPRLCPANLPAHVVADIAKQVGVTTPAS